MHSLLGEILAEKREEVKNLMERGMSSHRDSDIPSIRDFKGAISAPGGINLIGEIKFASPSAGIIREKADPLFVGRIYERAGAAAISLLTDKKFFNGDLRHLPRLKKAVSLPILRKDFIVDEIQVRESYLYGADAVLLIARILSSQQLRRYLGICRELGLAALTEVHDQNDLNKAIDCGAEIIGINNRDLDTFETSLGTSLKLAPLAPDEHTLVSESGIKDIADIQLLKQAGIQAILVGTSIMGSHDMEKKTKELVHAGKGIAPLLSTIETAKM